MSIKFLKPVYGKVTVNMKKGSRRNMQIKCSGMQKILSHNEFGHVRFLVMEAEF